ncbi:MAG: hypothetical protein IKL72_04260 [Firmicutes bacterium]|nr:hypothetical protein [Bacillota bacterium]
METVRIEITEYIDDLASNFFAESIGTVPKDNEALFTRMRVKKNIGSEAEVAWDEESLDIKVTLKPGETCIKEKDSLLEKFYIIEWEKAYKKAVLREILLRIAGE